MLFRSAERFRNVASRVPGIREETIVLDFLRSTRHPCLERVLQARVVQRVEDLWLTVEHHASEEDTGAPMGTPTGSSDSEHFPGCECEGGDEEDEGQPLPAGGRPTPTTGDLGAIPRPLRLLPEREEGRGGRA